MRLPELLLEDFNVYRAQTKYMADLIDSGVPLKPLKVTPERLKLMQEMADWCQERDLEPRQWLFTLFKSRNWVYPVKFERGSLLSENMRSRYAKMRGLGFFKKRVRQSKDTGGYDPNVDINGTVEALKFRYASSQQRQRCLDEIFVTTLGWHPDSAQCNSCPLARQCAMKLQGYVTFDIIALRMGRLTSSEAEAASRG